MRVVRVSVEILVVGLAGWVTGAIGISLWSGKAIELMPTSSPVPVLITLGFLARLAAVELKRSRKLETRNG